MVTRYASTFACSQDATGHLADLFQHREKARAKNQKEAAGKVCLLPPILMKPNALTRSPGHQEYSTHLHSLPRYLEPQILTVAQKSGSEMLREKDKVNEIMRLKQEKGRHTTTPPTPFC